MYQIHSIHIYSNESLKLVPAKSCKRLLLPWNPGTDKHCQSTKHVSGGTSTSPPVGVDGRDLGESKLRRRIRPMAEIGCSVALGGLQDLKSLQKLMWRFSASSMVMILSDLIASSLTASTHSPHIHRPWNFSRTRDMYSGVHSSVNPHDSHFTSSASAAGTTTLGGGS